MTKHEFVAGSYKCIISYGDLDGTGGDELWWDVGTTVNGFFIDEEIMTEPITCDDNGLAPQLERYVGKTVKVLLDYVEYEKVSEILYPRNSLTQGSASWHKGKDFGMIGRDTRLYSFKMMLYSPLEYGGNALRIYKFYKCNVSGNLKTMLSSNLKHGPITIKALPSNNPAASATEKFAYYDIVYIDGSEDYNNHPSSGVTPPVAF